MTDEHRRPHSLPRSLRWHCCCVAVRCALPFLVSNYRIFQLTLVLVYAIALLGLNILTGYNGQISLGHGAFYAIGAYVAAILMDKAGVPYWATVPVAGAVCLVAGFLFGLPALRLEGLYLALATFALGVSMPQLLKYHHLEKWTGGVQGIVIVKPDAPFGLPLNPDRGCTSSRWRSRLLMFVLAWNLLRGRVGRALVAIRDQPIAAEAMGINSALYKSLAFGVSAMYTGVAGALGAIAVQFVAPDSFTIFLSITLAGGHRGRRPGFDLRRALRRALHPVRAQHRRPDLQGGALGDLRRVPDRLRLPDADWRRGRHPPAGAVAARQAARSTDEAQEHHVYQAHFSLRFWLASPRRRWRRRNTTRAPPTPRSRSATPCPYSGPASAYGTIGKVDRRLLQDGQRRRAASTAARSTSSATTTATARRRRSRWCASWSSRTRCCSCSRRSARRPTRRSTST